MGSLRDGAQGVRDDGVKITDDGPATMKIPTLRIMRSGWGTRLFIGCARCDNFAGDAAAVLGLRCDHSKLR